MRRPRNRTIVLLVVAVLVLGAIFYFAFRLGRATHSVQVQLHPSNTTRAMLTQREGEVRYEVRGLDGTWKTMTPTDFAEAVWDEHQSRTVGQRVMLRALNISSSATAGWVLLGLLGQVLFAGRMVVQWLASERARASVIPNAFWWMALGGASMLLVYFIWRKDVVGILGQGTGWMIYSRNLYFIYFKKRTENPGKVQPAQSGPEQATA